MSAKTDFLKLHGGHADSRNVLLSYSGSMNQEKIEQLVDAATAVARLLDLNEATSSRLVSTLIEQCQNIAEHASGARSPAKPYERLGTVVIAQDSEGVYIETCWEVDLGAARPLKQSYEHLRGLTDAQLETEYRHVLMSKAKVPGEPSVGLFNVARNSGIGPDGQRKIAVEAEGSVMDSKIHISVN